MKRISLIFFLLNTTGITLLAQVPASLRLPRSSPKAQVSQRVGFTDIIIDYHSPAVKEREVWGTFLAPYGGKPYPWRAGANENTTITFTDSVRVEGQPLTAGTYGLHMIPSKDEFILILSKDVHSWGSFFYRPDQDALRATLTPEKASFREWLTYDFEIREPDYTVVTLKWENLKIPFKISVNQETTLNHIRNQLRSSAAFTSEGFFNAANYCLQNNINHEEAISWADRALRYGRTFSRLTTKSGLLKQSGNSTAADQLLEEAFNTGTDGELYGFASSRLRNKDLTDAQKTVDFMKSAYPDSWRTTLAIADIDKAKGLKQAAITSYEKALMAAPQNWKPTIQNRLKQLKEEQKQ